MVFSVSFEKKNHALFGFSSVINEALVSDPRSTDDFVPSRGSSPDLRLSALGQARCSKTQIVLTNRATN